MFTPQRKAWPGVSLTPRVESQRGGCGIGGSNLRSSSWKRKAVIALPEEPQLPPPPLTSVNGDEKNVDGFGTDNEDWKRFKEAGFLDTAVLEKKDMQALADRVSKLQKELFDYHHNMGLLLMEKKEWTSENIGLKQEVTEIKEILKREQSAHWIALAEAEKREDNLRRALSMEKQCVLDLEKTLHETHEEQARIQSVSQTKMAEADAIVVGIEGKSSVVEMKLQAAEAKLAEVNRQSAEMGMTLQQLESREYLLQKERLSFITDKREAVASKIGEREAAAGRKVGQNPLPIPAAPSPVKAAGDNNKAECDMRISTAKKCLSWTLNTPRDMVDANVAGRTSLDNVELMEEVSGTPEYSEDENGSTIYEVEDDDGHPGQASIGKKIWNIFTTLSVPQFNNSIVFHLFY